MVSGGLVEHRRAPPDQSAEHHDQDDEVVPSKRPSPACRPHKGSQAFLGPIDHGRRAEFSLGPCAIRAPGAGGPQDHAFGADRPVAPPTAQVGGFLWVAIAKPGLFPGWGSLALGLAGLGQIESAFGAKSGFFFVLLAAAGAVHGPEVIISWRCSPLIPLAPPSGAESRLVRDEGVALGRTGEAPPRWRG